MLYKQKKFLHKSFCWNNLFQFGHLIKRKNKTHQDTSYFQKCQLYMTSLKQLDFTFAVAQHCLIVEAMQMAQWSNNEVQVMAVVTKFILKLYLKTEVKKYKKKSASLLQ